MVWLLPHNIHTTRPSRKLDEKKIGPFKIKAKIGSNAYKLDLPTSIRIHNTFHISLLKPYEDDKFPSEIQEPPPHIQTEGEDEYELEEIIDSRFHYNKLQYRAMWKGYSPEHNKVWYPAKNFNNASLAVEPFQHQYPGKPRMATHHHQHIILCPCPRQGRTTNLPPRGIAQRAKRRLQRYSH